MGVPFLQAGTPLGLGKPRLLHVNGFLFYFACYLFSKCRGDFEMCGFASWFPYFKYSGSRLPWITNPQHYFCASRTLRLVWALFCSSVASGRHVPEVWKVGKGRHYPLVVGAESPWALAGGETGVLLTVSSLLPDNQPLGCHRQPTGHCLPSSYLVGQSVKPCM